MSLGLALSALGRGVGAFREKRTARLDKERERTLEEALAAQQMEDRTAQRASRTLDDEVKRATLAQMQNPRPTAPVRGTPEYLKAVEDEAKVNARYRGPSAIEIHKANREFDVKNPLPRSPGVPRGPTEAQEKSYVFYNLMKTAEPELLRLTQTGKVRPDLITLALRSGPLDFATNRLLNAEEQQYLRAARDFTAGVLRKESGAAIKNDEILNTMQRMIEQSGEGPDVGTAKQRARREYMTTMENAARPALLYYDTVNRKGIQSMDPAAEAADPGGGGISHGGRRLTPAQYAKVKVHYTDAELRQQGYEIP